MTKITISIWLVLSSLTMFAQDVDSLMQTLDQDSNEPVLSAFKSPKLVLLQTTETQNDQNLTFWISHRFGDIGGDAGGSHTLFGLDGATDIHIGFDYGITDDLTIGIGRSRQNEAYNLQAKYRLLEQLEANMPISLALFGQSSFITRRENLPDEFAEESDRISHFLQAIMARRFSSSFSFMLSPGYLMRSRVAAPGDKEDLFVLGFGGRLKITRSLSIIADYMLVNAFGRPDDLATEYYNPLGIGLEIETGGHVFSLNFQNATYITANNFIPETQKSWMDGGVRFGFTISRNFYLGPKDRTGN